MIISVIPIKKRIKILLQVSILNGNFSFNKISHILSQYNVFESHLVDEFLVKFSQSLNYILTARSTVWRFVGVLRVPLIIDIYKKKYKTDITICGYDFSSILKRIMDRRLRLRRFIRKRKRARTKKKYILFNNKLSILQMFKINLIHSLFFINFINFNHIKFKKKFLSLKLDLKMLTDRVDMKARNINFKRKDRKKI